MRHPEFPVVSFLCSALVLACLPSHIRARNISTLSLIAWLTVLNIIRGINAIEWANNTDVKLLVWCDITTKFLLGLTFAVPASALCIMRHLESVASTRQARITAQEKHHRRIFESIMCLGVPILFMALHYVVQGHRFDIIEDQGCQPSIYISVAGIILIYLPPLLMSMITFVYAIMTLHHFLRHRISFATHLQTRSGFSANRYFRLMALGVFEMSWDIGGNIFLLFVNVRPGLRPWISWENVHSNFSRVGRFPTFFYTDTVLSELTFDWWIIPVSSLAFFIFFGTGEEALSDYRKAFNWFRRTILRQDIPMSKGYGDSSLPSYNTSRNFSVSLPNSGGMSEQARQPWEDLSIKMPEFSQDDKTVEDDASFSTSPYSRRPSDNSIAAVALTALTKVRNGQAQPFTPSTISEYRGSLSTDANIVVSETLVDPKRTSWPAEQSPPHRLHIPSP